MAPEGGAGSPERELVRAEDLDARGRYQLLSSLVVPRPIGWISSRDPAGGSNLAPFSFYTALSTSPMLVGFSVGRRGDEPKDTLINVRAAGAFCVNVVGEALLEAMNLTAGDFGPEVDEARRAGLTLADAETVSAPYVTQAPAVLECDLYRIVDLDPAASTLVIGRVRAATISAELERVTDSRYVDSESLRPVARLYGSAYGLLGPIRFVTRPSDSDGDDA